jgi:hypothetical protein
MSLNQKPILLQEKQSEDILSHLKKAIDEDEWESVEKMACEFLQALGQRKVDVKVIDIYMHAKKMTKCITWTSRLIDAVRRTSYISETEKKQSREIAHTPINISNSEAENYASAMAETKIKYALAKATVMSHLSKLCFHLRPFQPSEKHHTVGNMHPRDPLDKPDEVNPCVDRFLSSIDLHMYALNTSIQNTKELIKEVGRQTQNAPSLSNILNMVPTVRTRAEKLVELIDKHRPKECEQKISPEQWTMWEIWIDIATLAATILEKATTVKLTAENLRPHVKNNNTSDNGIAENLHQHVNNNNMSDNGIAENLHQHVNNNNMSDNDIVQSIGRIEVLLDEMHKDLFTMGKDTKIMMGEDTQKM